MEDLDPDKWQKGTCPHTSYILIMRKSTGLGTRDVI
jgi:hypothetical protein